MTFVDYKNAFGLYNTSVRSHSKKYYWKFIVKLKGTDHQAPMKYQ